MVAVELPAEITASFVAEARSYLPQIEASLADLSNGEALSEAYRFAHTIKSSAAMMGHLGLSQLAELLEADLECVLLGEAVTTAQVVQLSRSVARIARLLDGVTGASVDVDLVLAEEVEDRMALERPAAEPEPVVVMKDAPELESEPLAVAAVVIEPGALAPVAIGLEPEREVVCQPEPSSEPSSELAAEATAEPGPASQALAKPEPLPVAEAVGEQVVSAAEDVKLVQDADERFAPLIDSLAETVLAFGREVTSGTPDPVAHRDSVAAWLTEFEAQAGIAPVKQSPTTSAPTTASTATRGLKPSERETREGREALLRAAIEAELRLQIEDEVRARLAQERPEAVNPFVAISARRATRAASTTRREPVAPANEGIAEDPEMREVFALEAAEHLKRIDADAAALRREPEDVERLRSLRRAVHTLKGAAAMMGFSAVADLAHSLEDRLDGGSADGGGLDGAALSRLFADLDRLEGLVTGAAPSEAPAAEAEPRNTVPAPQTEPSNSAAGPVAVPVRLERLDHLLTLAGESSVAASRWPEILSGAQTALVELRRTTARIESLLGALESERHRRLEEDRFASQSLVQVFPGSAARQADFDALELDRYTPTDYLAHEMAQIAAEASAAERELTSSMETAGELAEQQRRQASELQDRLLDVRLVPLDDLTIRLERAAHGVALRRGKEVEVVFEGTSVSVDRAVLDAVSDALQHLVRNAVDHGIEVPHERRARGKRSAGTVSVTARQAQGEVVIEVADDGAGIDVDRVRAAARAAGHDHASLDGDARGALELVFAPGVTTAPAPDDLSGRGVGLDAVAEALARIKGSVEVASEPGSGTIFLLRFPVTLAQARVLLAEVGGNPVALPAATVKHVTRASDVKVERTERGQSALLNGHSFPIGSLAATLGWPEAQATGDPPLVFVEVAGRRAAWTVDAIGTHADVVVKSLGGHLSGARGVAGASLLQDGRVSLLLHVPDLVERSADLPAWRPSLRRSDVPAQAHAGMRVLVVDDSPTIRKLLVRMLRDLGWQPREAKDGLEALEAIRVDRPDVVLADIEMPRLDGYGLLSAVRGQPATAALPVLMLTSRTAERHRQRAIELGATGYLTKPYRPEDVAAALLTARADAATRRVN